jgi:type IV secretory pathway VirB6-like protein
MHTWKDERASVARRIYTLGAMAVCCHPALYHVSAFFDIVCSLLGSLSSIIINIISILTIATTITITIAITIIIHITIIIVIIIIIAPTEEVASV